VVDSITFLFDHADMPARASKAMTHAIRLCGGADDPF
jgi:hypothetical protein